MRKIKELFFRYTGSNFLRCGIIWTAKVYVHVLQFLRSISSPGIYTPRLRTRGVHLRIALQIKRRKEDKISLYPLYPALPERTVTIGLPKSLNEYYLEPSYEHLVAQLPQGKIYGTDTALTADNTLLWDLNAYPHQGIYGATALYVRSLGKFTYTPGSVALVAGNDTDRNYNHWMTFGLPKLHLFQQAGIPIDWYATHLDKPFHVESLLAAGIPQKSILPLDKNTRIQAEQLLVATTTTVCGNLPPRAISYLRSLFLPATQIVGNKKRLFIARVTTRKIANEDEIIDLLHPYGFERVILDNMSIAEQAALFDQAEVVIGPHGAGFTNLVFCNAQTKVLELFQPKTVFGHYYCLSKACGLNYQYNIGKSVENKKILPMDRDMYISPKEIEKIFAQWGL